MPKKWPQKVLNGQFWNLNFQIFFFQNWKTQFSKQIVIYVVAFDPIKIQTGLLPQNYCQNLSFEKDNYVVGEKWPEMVVKIPIYIIVLSKRSSIRSRISMN